MCNTLMVLRRAAAGALGRAASCRGFGAPPTGAGRLFLAHAQRPAPLAAAARMMSVMASPPSTRAADRTQVGRGDIMPLEEYLKVRKELAQKFRAPEKKMRRVELGPSASILFTSYDLIWFQIHEMLRIEKGGEEQIPDELDAYKDLVPKGKELCGCLMYEIDNPVVRGKFLEKMVGSENDTSLSFGGETVVGKPIHDDIDRTHPDGRTSAVHFLRWTLSDSQVEKFKSGGPVVLKMGHKDYKHMTELSPELTASLAADL
mmetsp:Transcript_2276/g.5367  ORF Transcript_2276/g.5367 Transcript_2276/m.5367 type:complete len:260 (+) Transcript_2276:38-817(+)